MLETVEYSGSTLRELRKARKLTIKKLAEVSGVAERYLYMLEHECECSHDMGLKCDVA